MIYVIAPQTKHRWGIGQNTLSLSQYSLQKGHVEIRIRWIRDWTSLDLAWYLVDVQRALLFGERYGEKSCHVRETKGYVVLMHIEIDILEPIKDAINAKAYK